MDPASQIIAPEDASSAGQGLAAAVCLEALPIWAKQIDTARVQAQEAVVSLMKRFENIISRLDAALGAARAQTGTTTVGEDVAQGQQLLAQVIASLRAIRGSRDQLAEEIR